MHTTPLLINVHAGTFDEYVKSLSKSGRKNFSYVQKANIDLAYARVQYQPALIQRFMDLWEKQKIDGSTRSWAFGLGFVEFLEMRGHLMCFAATLRTEPSEILALHFVEKHGCYVICHPPMYDKEAHSHRYIAKYMWFRLIEYCLAAPSIDWLDLGGGHNGSWRDLLLNRDKIGGYKWHYVPESTKAAASTAPQYTVDTSVFPYRRRLCLESAPKSRLRQRVNDGYLSIILLSRKRRLRKLATIALRALHR
jgi:hypothetical protein